MRECEYCGKPRMPTGPHACLQANVRQNEIDKAERRVIAAAERMYAVHCDREHKTMSAMVTAVSELLDSVNRLNEARK